MRSRALSVAALLCSLPAVALEVGPGAPCGVHVSAAGGVGAAYGIAGGRIEVGYCDVAGFFGTGWVSSLVGGPAATVGVRWTPLGRSRWLVVSLHATGGVGPDARQRVSKPDSATVERYVVVAATIGAQLMLDKHFRVELAIGPAFSELRDLARGEDDVVRSQSYSGFGVFPTSVWGMQWPDVSLALGLQF